ncbi:hypothetical protein ACIBF1_23425 [Spirillospora sp. NPDC050679]
MNNSVRGGAVGVAAGAVLLSLVAPAHAAPGWRVTATPDRDAYLSQVAVISATEAWAVGGAGKTPLVRRWNGRTWNRVALPASVKDARLSGVSATSGKNVWVSGSNGRDKQFWMRWNGARWSVVTAKIPADSTPGAPELLAVSGSDVWSFARKGWGPFSPDVRHFDGKRWSVVRSPGWITEASAVSGKDVWATGWVEAPGAPVPTVLRWDGRSWKKQAQPLGKDGSLHDVLAFSAKNVWASGQDGAGRGVLLRWDGRTWKKSFAPNTKKALTGLAYDGAGGLWMRAGDRFLRYRAGKWSSVAVPAKPGYRTAVSDIAYVPKSTSVWAVGSLEDKRQVARYDAILKYGK